MSTIAVSRLHFPVRALGFGKRIGLWLQGCSIRCPGCISADTWRPGTGTVPVTTLLERLALWAEKADGLTVSGGEPLDQPDALAKLLEGWRTLSDRSVLLFTGYDWPASRPWIMANGHLVDAVIAGPFDASAGQSLALRGSDNQTLHVLSQLGEEFRQFERLRGPDDRRLDAMFDADGAVWFAGIPETGDFEVMAAILEGAGHRVVTSASKASA